MMHLCCRQILLTTACALIVFTALSRDAIAQAPPFPTIEITDPDDEKTFLHGDFFEAQGMSSQPNTPITIEIKNTYDGTTNTHVRNTMTDEGGNWTDNARFHLQGPGNWEVKVYLTNNPSIFKIHSGRVDGVP